MSEYRGREAHRSRITRYPREAASNRTGRPASLLLEHSRRAIVLPNAAWAFMTGMEDRAAGRLEEPPWGGSRVLPTRRLGSTGDVLKGTFSHLIVEASQSVDGRNHFIDLLYNCRAADR